MREYAFQYAVLRYVHDPVTQEFLNAGVVLYCKDAGYFRAIVSSRYRRLSEAFPTLDGNHYRRIVTSVESAVAAVQRRINPAVDQSATQLPLTHELPDRIEPMLAQVIQPDDSALVFGGLGGGLVADLDAELDHLYRRLVERYVDAQDYETRTDEEVWHSYREELDRHHLTQQLGSVTIKSPTYEYKFSHAWKNERWHPLESVSFDLVQSASILDKANRWIGRVATLADSDQLGTLYMLVGAPHNEELSEAYGNAIWNLRNKMPASASVEVIEEDAAADFSRRLAEMITGHDVDATGD